MFSQYFWNQETVLNKICSHPEVRPYFWNKLNMEILELFTFRGSLSIHLFLFFLSQIHQPVNQKTLAQVR